MQLEQQRKERNLYMAALAADEEQFRALIEKRPLKTFNESSNGRLVFGARE